MRKVKSTLITLAFCLPFTLLGQGVLTLPNSAIKTELIERGSGEYRKFGFHVYNAKLWTRPNQNTPPYALQLKYFMDIKANKIVEASLKEMRGLGVTDTQLAEWKKALTKIIPDVTDGDVITGINTGNGAEFYLNDSLIGFVDSAAFATDFFGIWLSPKTSDSKFRTQLLQQ